MITRCNSVAFQGIEAKLIDVQCALSAGMPSFQIVGLPDKAVSEARERVRAAITALGLAMPAKRITINLSPADMPKEGSHFDLPIALSILAAMEVIPAEELKNYTVMGELSLDGQVIRVLGALPAALAAGGAENQLICPNQSAPEAAWVNSVTVFGVSTLQEIIQHFTGRRVIAPAEAGEIQQNNTLSDLSDVKGQERAKRALEIAAAGRHHLLMVGPPGSGKSMLAARLPSILPPLSATEALETSMVHSLAGLIDEGGISKTRPFRDPHHTASMAAIVGGGRGAKPGEISLAHNGILFLDELPEFSRTVLETLRQPIETRSVMVARANAHVSYPCAFMLIAAANPCRCGQLADPALACGRAPLCGEDYMGRISGPLLDRFDLRIDVPAVPFSDLTDLPNGVPSNIVANRVLQARTRQAERYKTAKNCHLNADLSGTLLDEVINLDSEGETLMRKASERFKLTARGYHRILRVARTIADLEGSAPVTRAHLGEAISFRLPQKNKA